MHTSVHALLPTFVFHFPVLYFLHAYLHTKTHIYHAHTMSHRRCCQFSTHTPPISIFIKHMTLDVNSKALMTSPCKSLCALVCTGMCVSRSYCGDVYSKYWKKMFYCTLSEHCVSLMQRATVENVCIAFSFVAMLTVCLPLGQLTLRKAILISVIFTW